MRVILSLILINTAILAYANPFKTEETKPVIRIFSGKFCPPCRKQEKIMQLPSIQDELKRYEQHKYLDVEDGDKFLEYGVNAVPYLIIEKNGSSRRLVGLQTESSILSALKD